MKFKIGDIVDYVIKTKIIYTCVIIEVKDYKLKEVYYEVKCDGVSYLLCDSEMRLNKSHRRKLIIEELL